MSAEKESIATNNRGIAIRKRALVPGTSALFMSRKAGGIVVDRFERTSAPANRLRPGPG